VEFTLKLTFTLQACQEAVCSVRINKQREVLWMLSWVSMMLSFDASDFGSCMQSSIDGSGSAPARVAHIVLELNYVCCLCLLFCSVASSEYLMSLNFEQ
jgi:hypothetical protein